MMTARDPHRFINELEDEIIDRLISRLESRARDEVFTRLLDNYLSSLELPRSAKVLEIGCGTGAVLRRLVRRDDFKGTAHGVDQSTVLLNTAQQLLDAENLTERVEYSLGDAHSLAFPAESFDAVIAHTLISHVTDPELVLQEMSRVLRPGGVIVIFDGDYASLTYSFPDYNFGREMDLALATATFNNPRIMRELPRLLPEYGLQLKDAWGDAVAEIGKASYFRSFAETYAPFVVKAGMFPASRVDSWLAVQHQSMEDGSFFAACNYYTYLANRAT